MAKEPKPSALDMQRQWRANQAAEREAIAAGKPVERRYPVRQDVVALGTTDGEKPKFDKKAYQRELMRKRRAADKAARLKAQTP